MTDKSDRQDGDGLLFGLEERLDRLCLTAKDGSQFILSTKSARNGAGNDRGASEQAHEADFLDRERAFAPPKLAPDAMREALVDARLYVEAAYQKSHHAYDKAALEQIDAALSTPVPPANGVPDNVLPCDVHLPPNTFLRKGCQFDAFMTALRARYSFPSELQVFASPSPAVAAEPVAWTKFRFLQVAFGEFKEYELRQLVEEISKQLGTTLPVRDDREAICEAIRAYCRTLGKTVVHTSSDGIDRIYYSGLSVQGIADAVIPVQPGAGERE